MIARALLLIGLGAVLAAFLWLAPAGPPPCQLSPRFTAEECADESDDDIEPEAIEDAENWRLR